jgi:hypothetical protein
MVNCEFNFRPTEPIGWRLFLSLSLCLWFVVVLGFPCSPKYQAGLFQENKNKNKKNQERNWALWSLEAPPHKQPNSTNSRSKISSSLSTLQMKRKFPWVEREQQSVLPTDSVPLA